MTIDPVFTGYDWERFLEAAAPLSSGADLPRVRAELAIIRQELAGFRQFNPVVERAHWKRVNKRIDELATELKRIRRALPWDATDPLWPNRLLAALTPFKQKAEAAVEGFDILARIRRGKSSPAREWLYWRLRTVWMNHCGGQLGVSMSQAGPYGPAIRFLVAAVAATTGEVLKPHTARDIIKPERRRKMIERARRRRKKAAKGVLGA